VLKGPWQKILPSNSEICDTTDIQGERESDTAGAVSNTRQQRPKGGSIQVRSVTDEMCFWDTGVDTKGERQRLQRTEETLLGGGKAGTNESTSPIHVEMSTSLLIFLFLLRMLLCKCSLMP
jgi:hypothetical protein